MAKSKREEALQFNVLFEKDEDGYFVASVPELNACYTQGKTLEEAKKRIKEVIKLCLKDKGEYKKVVDRQNRSNFIGIESVTIQYA